MASLLTIAPLRTEFGAYCDECSQPGTRCWCANDGFAPDDTHVFY